MAKFIVTGASGYIGGYLANFLFEMGHEVIAPIRESSEHSLNSGIRIIRGDLWEIDEIIWKKAAEGSILIHLAWQDGFVHSSDSHMSQLSSHFDFINKLIRSGIKKFVGLGSMHELGLVSGLVTEDCPALPVNQYGIAKNALRASVNNLCLEHSIDYLWLRCFYILGDDYKNKSVFSKMLELEIAGVDEIPLTEGNARFDFIQVNDLALLIAKASQEERLTGILNLGSGNVMTLRDRIEQFKIENNLSLRLNFGAFPERQGIGEGAWPDLTKMKSNLTLSTN